MVRGSETASGKLCENPREEISEHPTGLGSQVPHQVYALMKNADDRNPVGRLPKVYGMLFDIASPIAPPGHLSTGDGNAAPGRSA